VLTATPAPRRINVTGNAGAGKSTVASALGEATGIDVVGLDQIVWQPGWRPTPTEQRAARIAEVIERPTWVVDGVSGMVRQSADLIVFIDLKRRISLWRCTRRNLRYLWRSRPDLPEGCPEALVIHRLVKMIMRFPREVRPTILRDAEHVSAFVHVRTRAELDDVLARLRAVAARSVPYPEPAAAATDTSGDWRNRAAA
jgi:adenylate kinase family enzyme